MIHSFLEQEVIFPPYVMNETSDPICIKIVWNIYIREWLTEPAFYCVRL